MQKSIYLQTHSYIVRALSNFILKISINQAQKLFSGPPAKFSFHLMMEASDSWAIVMQL